MPTVNYAQRNFSDGSIEVPFSTSQISENWETYDEGSEPEEEFDTPRAMHAKRHWFDGMMPMNAISQIGPHSPTRNPTQNRRSGSMNSTMSGKARAYIQQQSQRGQDLIAELMEEAQEVDDEWGDEGF